ncbi:MAG: recombinase family protein [Cetobacterium sp.]
MKNIVAYVRVSSQSQVENTSIESQIEKIQLHCKLYDMNIVKIFKDEAKSAKEEKSRPAYKEMISFIKDKKNNIDAILVYKNDRLHRSLYNLLNMIYELEKLEVDLISVTEQFDTGTPQGMLFVQMLGSFSEFERKIINERTKTGRISKGNSELYAGGRVPFGYTLVDNDRLTLNYDEVDVIKEIYRLRIKGMSLAKIGIEVGMSKERVYHIIKNRIYIGNYTYNGKKEKNKISFKVPSIVSNYIWTKANSIGKQG